MFSRALKIYISRLKMILAVKTIFFSLNFYLKKLFISEILIMKTIYSPVLCYGYKKAVQNSFWVLKN
jgi:hypothetical protein